MSAVNAGRRPVECWEGHGSGVCPACKGSGEVRRSVRKTFAHEAHT